MSHDPYSSIREALKANIVIECRSSWESIPYFAESRRPFYTWDNRAFPSGLLKTQLEAADTWGLLEWETVEQNSTNDLFKLEKETGSSNLNIWRKQLRAIKAPAPDQTAPYLARPKLGETRLVRAKAFRHKLLRENPHGVEQEVAWWESRSLPEPILAVYTGFRSVYEGIVLNSGYSSDTPGLFIIHRTLEAWKFVDNPRHCDYYVFPTDIVKE